MLYTFLVLLYVVVSLFLILVVLLQTGKRADLAGAFGGGGSQTALGTRGAANLLTKFTTISAVLFMVIALTLSIMASRRSTGSGSVLDEIPASSAPAAADTGGTPEGLAPALGEGPADGAASGDPLEIPVETPASEGPDASTDSTDSD